MDLLLKLASHESRLAISRDYPNHPEEGFCIRCDSALTTYGRNEVNCEYHWLKSKFKSIQKQCKASKTKKVNDRNKHLINIRCEFNWASFIVWCSKNDQYKTLVDPALLRIDKTKNFNFENIRWGEWKEIARTRR